MAARSSPHTRPNPDSESAGDSPNLANEPGGQFTVLSCVIHSAKVKSAGSSIRDSEQEFIGQNGVNIK